MDKEEIIKEWERMREAAGKIEKEMSNAKMSDMEEMKDQWQKLKNSMDKLYNTMMETWG